MASGQSSWAGNLAGAYGDVIYLGRLVGTWRKEVPVQMLPSKIMQIYRDVGSGRDSPVNVGARSTSVVPDAHYADEEADPAASSL